MGEHESRRFRPRMREAGCSIKEQRALMSNLGRAKTDEARFSVMRQIEAAIERAESKKVADSWP